uniref:solute carrier family 26 member 6-like n=1 Tax=Oncorhynchus gorbuscha TaxID=8017 RepID=UPI001EAEF144|nr:solute carrier family 26 member 6-like [Oncorhynchus gorbuscha]
MYQDALAEKSGIDITKLISQKKKAEAKRLRKEKKEARKAKKDAKKNGQEWEGEPDSSENEVEKGVATVEEGSKPDSTLPRAIILELSPVNFLDTVGVKTLRNIQRDYGDIGVEVVLCGCQTGVVENLESGGFFSEKVSKACLFSSIHDAVLHCQTDRAKMNKDDEEMQATHF